MMKKGVRTWFKINLLSILVGITGGLGAIVFRKMIEFFNYIFFSVILNHITYQVGSVNLGMAVLPALGGLVVGPIVNRFAPETKGHGVPEVLEAVTIKGGVIRSRVAAVKILVSSLTIGSGGSVGREGPIAQIGSSVGSMLGQMFSLPEPYRKLLVVCGLASGISGTFMAPLGGAIFGIEVIYSGVAAYDVIPVILSSVVGMFVTAEVFGLQPAFLLPVYHMVNPLELIYFVPIGALFGFMAITWTRGLYLFEDLFDGVPLPEWLKPSIGGLLTGLLAMFFVGYGIFGTGYEGLDLAFAGELSWKMLIILGVVKFLATGITIGSGSSGGIFAPSLYMGCMFGGALGCSMMALPFASKQLYVYAIVGMAALFSGAAKAPLTCIIMLPEMSGNYYLLAPLMLACASSYFVSTVFMDGSIYTLKLKRRGVEVDPIIDPLKLVYVEEIMTHADQVVNVKPDTALSVVSFMIWETEHTGFPVIDNGRYAGMITLESLSKVPQEQLEALKAEDIMVSGLPPVYPRHTGHYVAEMMNREFEILPVLDPEDGERLLGVVSDADVLKAIQLGKNKMSVFG
jgi:CIC family chloride channel protein